MHATEVPYGTRAVFRTVPGALLVGVLFAVMAASYLINLPADDFDGDEYWYALAMTEDARRFLSEPRPLLGLQFVPVLQLADRAFDDRDPYAFHRKLAVTRLPGALIGLLVLAAATWLVPKRWPAMPALFLMVAIGLTFNDHSLRYVRWGMLIFVEYLLLSTLLYFAFLAFLQNELSLRTKMAAGAVSIVLPFVYFPTLPPFCVGLTGVILLRSVAHGRPTLQGILIAAREAWVFFVAIPAYAASAFFEPWRLARRQATADFFYPTSEDAGSPAGPLLFLARKTAATFGKLVLPRTGLGAAVDTLIGLLILVLVVIALLRAVVYARRWNDRASLTVAGPSAPLAPARLFTLWYVGATTMGIAFLSVLGVYPFGLPRYSFYLLVPVLVLAGIGLEDLAGYFRRRGMKKETGRAGNWVLLGLLVAAGAVRIFSIYHETAERDRINAVLREKIIVPRDEILLYSRPVERFYAILMPEKLADAVMVSYGANDTNAGKAIDLKSIIADLDSAKKELVLAYWGRGAPENEHATVTALLKQHGWQRTGLVQQDGVVGILGLATFTRAGASPAEERD